MSGIKGRYKRHADQFEQRVAALTPDQWENQSPCENWTALDVVDHVVMMHGAMLTPLGLSLSPAPTVDEDPLAAFKSARADVEAVLNDPKLAGALTHSPAGDLTAEAHIDQVISDDMVLHGWDLARATGQDDTMDPEDVQRLWAVTNAVPAAMMDKMRTPGAFGPGVVVYGPEIKVPDDAPPQHKLLGAIGRNPY